MSLVSGNRKRIIEEDDLVIIFEKHDSITSTFVKAGSIFNNKFGAFYHNDMIGKPYGSKIRSRCSNGWVIILAPTIELWAHALLHRTQIVNEVDAAFVVFHLHLIPGCKVIESGTGSGSMSTAIARSIAPTGHLYTFEFNEVRAQAARETFEKNGIGYLITVTHKDACVKDGDGFGLESASIDAVFLDLPEPWIALPHALRALKPNGTLCSYSPCIEQTMRACEVLASLNFHSIKTFETRFQTYGAKNTSYESLNTNPPRKFRKVSDGQKEQSMDFQDLDAEETKDDININKLIEGTIDDDNCNNAEEIQTTEENQDVPNIKSKKRLVSFSYPSMKGHTAFLTFATAPLLIDETILSQK